MNTYRITGRYRLWDSSTKLDTDFNLIVLAEKTEQAICIVKANYRDAEIVSTLLRDEEILVSPQLSEKEGAK